MKKNYTHISILLDASGSMATLKNDTIGGFNQLIEDQQRQEGEATVSLFQFNNESELLYEFKNIQKVNPLTNKNYKTNGGTALYNSLYDCIERTGRILSLMEEENRLNLAPTIFNYDNRIIKIC